MYYLQEYYQPQKTSRKYYKEYVYFKGPLYDSKYGLKLYELMNYCNTCNIDRLSKLNNFR